MITREMVEKQHWCEYCKYVIVGSDTVCRKCRENRPTKSSLWRVADDVDVRIQIMAENGYVGLSKYLFMRGEA